MASLGCLLCVVSLLLCGATSLGLRGPRRPTTEKPIIVEWHRLDLELNLCCCRRCEEEPPHSRLVFPHK
ncbi:hypothetical protein GW7_02897 [Heterocephalus glaber]|uniref:Uncharacterized protein n=1 Tax=Heterocephalus glaber TaxID=10181 RepID=G5BIT3_HETGA|nr:hypothetical protein GW7_02897 [Heterocephalus glaber]